MEDIREATGGDAGLLDSRDHGFFTVAMLEFWHRPEMAGMLRDVQGKPGPHDNAAIYLSSERFRDI